MIKTIVKNGVITETIDTCDTIEEARTEILNQAREARGQYFDEAWHKLGYNQIDRDMVITNTANAEIVISGENLGSIEFVSASPDSIVLKGTGGQGKQETSTYWIIFRDKQGLYPRKSFYKRI